MRFSPFWFVIWGAACGTSETGFVERGPSSSERPATDPADAFGTCSNGRRCDGQKVVTCPAANETPSVIETCAGDSVCVNGACARGCAAAEARAWNLGCEFWAVHLDNTTASAIGRPASSEPWGLYLANAGSVDAHVKVERNEAAYGAPARIVTIRELVVKANSLETVELPAQTIDGSSAPGRNDGPGTWASSMAIRVHSTEPIVMHQMNAFRMIYSNDASLLLPKNGLGTSYRILSWTPSTPVSPGFSLPGIPERSFVTIVGTEPDTRVTVQAAAPTVAGGSVARMNAGATQTFTIGPFDVINVESDGAPGDLTGSAVVSNKPVAVFAGTEASLVPDRAVLGSMPDAMPPSWKFGNNCCTDHLEEQMLPVTSVGRRYAVGRSPVRSIGGYIEYDIIRVISVAAETDVTTNLAPPHDRFHLGVGESRAFPSRSGFTLEATEPVIVGQYLASMEYTERGGGDASFTVLPAVDQFRSDYRFLVPPTYVRHEVVVTLPDTATLTLDGQPMDCVRQPVGVVQGKPYVSRTCRLAEGVHTVITTEPASLVVVGYGPASSYAFLGGANVDKIYSPPSLIR